MSIDQMGLDVSEQGETLPARSVETPEQVTSLVQLAIERGVEVEVLERLVALQERVTERNAELAMAEAMAAFQESCPPIPRNREAEVRKRDGTYAYSYYFAALDEIVRVIRPHLIAHGLSYAHDAEVANNTVTVTCTLQHIAGATRQATFSGPVDNSGGKNPLQGVGSARSYGRRYTLMDVLGLTTEDDDDGQGAGNGGGGERDLITDEQAAALDDIADEAGADKAAFCEWLGVPSIAEIPAPQYDRAKKALDRKLSEARGK